MYDNYMGVIQALGFNFAPAQWAFCGGQIVTIAQQTALFSLLGCRFGGNCRDVFGYPDLRGRIPISQFQGPGLPDWVMGMMPGVEHTYMSYSRMPTHTHAHSYAGGGGSASPSVSVAKTHGTVQTPSHGDYLAEPSDSFGSAAEGNLFVTQSEATAAGTANLGGAIAIGGAEFNNQLFMINNTGAGNSFDIVEPSLVVNYCICIDGLYPSRS